MSGSLLRASLLVFVLAFGVNSHAAELVQTPYSGEQKVLFDIYLDDPRKMGSALYWIRAFANPLTEEPYGYAMDFMDIKVVVHGTEIVTLVSKNYERYRDVVERIKYYAEFGVEFRICAIAAQDYGYVAEDFPDFVKIVPSAITELAHWQQQGYGLITPKIMEKRFSIEEIR